ncbi:Ser/Thr protein phosphatase [Mycena belliarum]|uniref:Ser/Thr protein phosphatase n=1 Tax=Mycena belliarum TaxID=1033014 RepID=A0AAD6UFA6_9AGAR|nr:Ser/Thr protein phosphatase [Mycena belliae]
MQPSPRPGVSPLPRVNTQTKVLDTAHGRILCIADIRGRLSALNDLAREANAHAIIHTGDFGFFETNSLERINDRTLRHLTMYSPLISSSQRTHLLAPDNPPAVIRSTVNIALLSEFPLLLSGQLKLRVPVYTVWGACEDVLVIEKFRSGSYAIENLHLLDEATTRCLDLGGVKLRLLGLGGALVPHKMFDNGDGNATIAGGQGTMWTTALQIGELVDTAQRVFDPTETRMLVTHASPGREGLMAQLALVTKADLTISAGLHFRYATSYNEFSVQGSFDGVRAKLTAGKESFDRVWESVKTQVDAVIDEHQRVLLDKALSVVERVPTAAAGEEPAWKNCWNWNLCDAAYGSLILDVKEGRISAELKSQGFNYAYRRTATAAPTPSSVTSALPASKSATPVPGVDAQKDGSSPSTPATNLKPAEKKKKEKKERKDKDKESAPADVRATLSPAPAADGETVAADAARDLKSPTDGARTPKSGRPTRNPWTIFMKMTASVAVTDADVREFFGEAKGGITKITLPPPFAGRPQRLGYIEFGDEEAMRAGLEKHLPKIKDIVPEVKQATERVDAPHRGGGPGGPGRGRGRGGGGGGSYARRRD